MLYAIAMRQIITHYQVYMTLMTSLRGQGHAQHFSKICFTGRRILIDGFTVEDHLVL